jgi:hypothetical protein
MSANGTTGTPSSPAAMVKSRMALAASALPARAIPLVTGWCANASRRAARARSSLPWSTIGPSSVTAPHTRRGLADARRVLGHRLQAYIPQTHDAIGTGCASPARAQWAVVVRARHGSPQYIESSISSRMNHWRKASNDDSSRISAPTIHSTATVSRASGPSPRQRARPKSVMSSLDGVPPAFGSQEEKERPACHYYAALPV